MPEITHDTAVQVSPHLRRITAPNPGRMTGPGTNTYIVGEHELAVIDPGPPIASHVDNLVRICAGKLRWILVTHTHRDHSPAAALLAERTGAELIGNVIDDDGHQDTSFVNARSVAQDELISNKEFTIRAILTPGHVANHVCYLVEQDGMLVTGDHMMGGSTVVIVPPAGDMQAYIHSLERMLQYELTAVAPGHGDLIAEPAAEVRRLIKHRLQRERKVAAALAAHGPCDVMTLVPPVYEDVDPAMHSWAALSLHAHLIKLEREGAVELDGESWRCVSR